MPDINDFLKYLGYDEVDDLVRTNAVSALNSAGRYLQGVVGEDVFELLPDDPRVTELVKIYAKDFYDERSTSAKSGNAKRAMVHSMEWQLRLELSHLREQAEGAVE